MSHYFSLQYLIKNIVGQEPQSTLVNVAMDLFVVVVIYSLLLPEFALGNDLKLAMHFWHLNLMLTLRSPWFQRVSLRSSRSKYHDLDLLWSQWPGWKFRCFSVILEKTFLISVRPWSTLRISWNYELCPQLNLCNHTHSKFVLESQSYQDPWDISTDSYQVRSSCIQLTLLYRNQKFKCHMKVECKGRRRSQICENLILSWLKVDKWPKESLSWFQQDL